MNVTRLRMRVAEIREELERKSAALDSGKISPAEYKAVVPKLVEEGQDIKSMLDLRTKALHYAGAADMSTLGAAAYGTPPTVKSSVNDTGHSEPKWSPGSPLSATQDQLHGMWEAIQRKQAYRMEIPAVSSAGFQDEIGLKTAGSPVSDSGLGGPPYSPTPTGLPAVIQPGLTMPIRLEPDRLWAHLPGISVDAPAIEYLAHTGDTNNPAVVAELGTASDVGMQLSTTVVTSTKIGALASASVEALQDFKYFASFIPSELSRLMINEETNYVANGGTEGGPTGFTGILAISGTLTRSVGSDTPIDALQKSFNDLRVGSAYATADLVAMHPTTWNAIQRQKSSFNTYLLDPNPATGIVDSIFGVTVVVNTWIPVGTAIVLDTNQSLLAWTRSSLIVEANPYGDGWDSFYWQFRAWERIGLGIRWVDAINIVTGLPTS